MPFPLPACTVKLVRTAQPALQFAVGDPFPGGETKVGEIDEPCAAATAKRADAEHGGATGVVEVGGTVVVGATAVVELAGTLVVVVALLLVELRVTSAVIPMAASATMAAMTTILHPFRIGVFFSASSEPSAIGSLPGVVQTLEDRQEAG